MASNIEQVRTAAAFVVGMQYPNIAELLAKHGYEFETGKVADLYEAAGVKINRKYGYRTKPQKGGR